MSTQSQYIINAIAGGYLFECACGELANSILAARTCRKCRNYSNFPGRHVTNIETNELVYGSYPTEAEELAAAEAYHEECKQSTELLAKEMEYDAEEEAQISEWNKIDIWELKAEELGY